MICAQRPVTPVAPSHNRREVKNAPRDWRISLHRHPAALETTWRQLEAQGHCTVFQTYDWAACWYDAFASRGQTEPLIVLVTQGDERPVWILPLCLSRKKGLRIITFADLGVTDYAAPVLAEGAPSDQASIKTILKAVFKALPACDLIHFQKLVATVEGATNPLLALDGVVRYPMDCHGIRLTEPWPTLAAKIMQSRLRSAIRRQKKKIQSHGEIAVEHLSDSGEMASGMEQLMAMRRARFAAIGRADMPPLWHDFYQALATRHDRTLDVSVTTMTVSGEAVATCFGLTRNGAYHAILPTFALGKWESFKPGMLLFDAILEAHASKTEGRGYFDFTIGDEPYKKRFGSECHHLYEWMAPRSIVGVVACRAWRMKNALSHYRQLLAARKLRRLSSKKGD